MNPGNTFQRWASWAPRFVGWLGQRGGDEVDALAGLIWQPSALRWILGSVSGLAFVGAALAWWWPSVFQRPQEGLALWLLVGCMTGVLSRWRALRGDTGLALFALIGCTAMFASAHLQGWGTESAVLVFVPVGLFATAVFCGRWWALVLGAYVLVGLASLWWRFGLEGSALVLPPTGLRALLLVLACWFALLLGGFAGGIVRRHVRAVQARDWHYQALFRSVPSAVVLHRQGRVLDGNDAAVRLLGLRGLDELLGQDLRRWCAPGSEADLQGHIDGTAAPAEGELPSAGRFELRQSGGRLVPVSGSARRVPYEGGEAVLSFWVDETQRRGAEQALAAHAAALEAQGRRLAGFLDSSEAAAWEMDLAARTVRANVHYARMLGLSVERLNPVTVAEWFQLVHPQDREAVAECGRRHLQNPMQRYQDMFRLLTADGQTVWVLNRGCVTEWSDAGEPRVMLGIAHNITALVQARQAAEAAQERAERANEAKSQFLSTMSHELRTPLNAILGFGQLLVRDASLQAEQRECVHEIHQAGQHLLALINDVLDLSRIDSGRLEVSIAPQDWSSVLAECLEAARPLAAGRRIQFHTEGPAGVWVRADRSRLQQVVFNLVSNAVKYNREGGRIGLAWSVQPGARWRLRVSDTGPGIAPEVQHRLFQPFERGPAPDGGTPGMGIGLTIADRIVRLMGGQMGFETVQGQGSTFWVELPLADPPVTATLRRVLCIDDQPSNLKLVRQILSDPLRLELLTAEDPAQGLALLAERGVDLVLLDINLPGMDGYETLKALRRLPGGAHTPVLAVTANAMERDLRRIREAGFADAIIKPFDVLAFQRTVWAHLEPA